MKLTRYFETHQEAFAFEAGLQEANTGHLHSIERGSSVDYPGMVFVTWHNESRQLSELPKKHPPLPSAQYVVYKGTICPVCYEFDMTGHEVEYSHRNKLVTRGVSCNNPDCEASWSECYELSGYDNLER